MKSPLSELPEWAKTIDPGYRLDLSTLKPVALEFSSLSVEAQRAEVRICSQKYCFPRLVLGRASGLYLMFRTIFDLPTDLDRAQAQVFGGWLHPSIGQERPFNLSWPVSVSEEAGRLRLTVHRFRGYSGKGYDALGEFEYFTGHFPRRSPQRIGSGVIG
jgi:hypothetical protein